MKRIYLAALLALATPALADKITLANGRVIEGRVVSMDRDRVVIESGGMVTPLARSSVKSVERATGADNTLLSAENSLKRRDIPSAVDLLLQAMKEGAPPERIDRLLDQYNMSVDGAAGNASAADQPAIRQALRKLMDSKTVSRRMLFHLAQDFFKLQDITSAGDALDQIGSEYIEKDPAVRAWALDFMRQLVKRQLARNDFEGALAYVERMRRLTNDADDPHFPLAHMARAAAARDQNRYAEAFAIIAKDLQPQMPEVARNRAAYTIDQMMLWLAKEEKYDYAREAITPIKNIFPVEYYIAVNKIILAEAKSRMLSGDATGALFLIDEIPEGNRSQELIEVHRHAFHEAEMLRIPATEPLELLKHGRWCVENGLLDEAMVVFNITRENPSLKDVSDELLITSRLERDTRLLEAAHKAYEEGRLEATDAYTAKILQNPDVGSSLSKEAQHLSDLSRKSRQRSAEERPYRAEVFYQQAERAYFTQQFDESFNLVKLILDDYADTPAAARAAKLLPDVLRAIELAFLEGKRTQMPDIPEKFQLEKIQKNDALGEEVKKLLDANGDLSTETTPGEETPTPSPTPRRKPDR